MKVLFTATYQWEQEIPDCDDVEQWIEENDSKIHPGFGDSVSVVDAGYKILKDGYDGLIEVPSEQWEERP